MNDARKIQSMADFIEAEHMAEQEEHAAYQIALKDECDRLLKQPVSVLFDEMAIDWESAIPYGLIGLVMDRMDRLAAEDKEQSEADAADDWRY